MHTTFYFIRSSTDRNTFYRVSETRGRYTCECKDFTYRGPKTCKHIEQVERGCGIVAQPKPAPARIATTATSRRRSVTMAV